MPSEVRRDITLIGGSAGSITALRRVLHGLPKDYPAQIFVVVHIAPESPSFLHELVVRAGPLAAVRAEHGMPIVPGRIVVAPPDLHLFLSGDRVHLSRGPRENRHRPAIDVLFRSGAVTIGPRVTGVAMSGMLTARQGCGRSSSAAASPSCSIRRMRSSATCAQRHAHRRHGPCATRGGLRRPPGDAGSRAGHHAAGPRADRDGAREPDGKRGGFAMEELDALGERVPLTCPECGGSLSELEADGPGLPRSTNERLVAALAGRYCARETSHV